MTENDEIRSMPVMINAAPGYGGERTKGRVESWLRPKLHLVLPVIVYVVLVLLGATTSSIGTSELRQEPTAPLGAQLGSSSEIRSDEYLTESPLWLGQMAVGTEDLPNTVGASPDFFAQLPSGPASSIVFFDGSLLTLGPWLPDAMLFAAKWWLPTLLLLLGLPIWFKQVTGSMRWGYLASILILVSPSSAWWSGRPVNTLGFIAAGCALGIWGISRLEGGRRWLGAAGVIGAGILLARYPSYYQPLAIMVGLPLVLATLAHLITRDVTRRARWTGVAWLTLSGALWTGLLLWENRQALRAGLATVYPGDRASSSESLTIGRIFGATNLGWLDTVGNTIRLGQNKTEIASSFTVLLVVVAVMLAARTWRGGRRLAWTTAPVVALAVFWLVWGTIYLGPVGAAIPLVNRVPGFRASHGAGFIAILAFCLVMSQWRESRNLRVPAVAGLVAAFFSAWAGSSLQMDFLPALTGKMIWSSALVTGLIVFALLRWPYKWQPMAATAVAGLVLTMSANPIIFGLGDLRVSTTAQLFLDEGEQARDAGDVWASDSRAVDALFLATGTPSLSTRQQIGPDAETWDELDPGAEHENYWNRGGTFINFVWTDEEVLRFELPSPDRVTIYGSPCAVADRVADLTAVTSLTPLDDECLVPAEEFRWSGVDHYVYDVTRP